MTHIRRAIKGTWARIREADIVDWLFAALFAVVGGAVAVFFFAWITDEPAPWNAIAYQAPVELKDSTDTRPTVADRPDLPAPAVRLGDGVPLRVTRLMDCATFECPSGAIKVLADVTWVQVRIDDRPGLSFPEFVDVETSLVENEDYTVGQFRSFVRPDTRLTVPPEVVAFIRQEGDLVSAWRVEGTTQAQIPGAAAASWSSEIFHLFDPAQAEVGG